MQLARAVAALVRPPGGSGAGTLSRGARGMLVLVGAALAVAGPSSAAAQAVRGERVLLQGGGSLPVGYNNVFSGNDDASVGPLNIGYELNFFGITHTQLFLNNNGNVTFGGATPEYTPFGLSGDLGVLTGNPAINGIIAPFFGDVDTRVIRSRVFIDAGGNVISQPTGVGLTTWGVFDATDPLGAAVGGHRVFSVNWSDVGFYNRHTNATNTFQLNLIERLDTGAGLGNFDIEFNYDAIEWETGTASGGDANGRGGQSAHVGYSNGTGDPGTFVELFGSGVNGAFVDGGPDALISNSFGSAVPGRYVFQVRNTGSGIPGETEQNPALPSTIIPGDPATGVGPTYVFRGFGNGRWADPPDSYGFLYTGVNGTLFSGVGLPGGFDPLDVCWGAGFASCVNDVAAGSTLDFLTLAGGPLGVFRITGINPLVDSSNPNGFPTQMFFTTPTGDFDMTALIVRPTAAPEPQTFVLLGFGLVALYGVRRRVTHSA